MVFEQMLTILLGTGVGVAVVLFTVKPRQVIASQSFGGTSIETFTLSSPSASDSQNDDAAPAPAVIAAAQTQVVEAPPVVGEFNAISSSSGVVSTVTADVAIAASSDAPIAEAAAAPAVVISASPARRSVTATAARTHRVSRRSTAVPRAHARSRAGSHAATNGGKTPRSARRSGVR